MRSAPTSPMTPRATRRAVVASLPTGSGGRVVSMLSDGAPASRARLGRGHELGEPHQAAALEQEPRERPQRAEAVAHAPPEVDRGGLREVPRRHGNVADAEPEVHGLHEE